MDSLRPDVEAYYEAQGTKVVKDPYQYSTDITKALQYCQTRYGSPEISGGQVKKFNVALLGGLGGRGDQAFSLLNHISTPDAMPNMGDIFLITPESIIFQLRNGKNRITTPVDQDRLGENVGIIPLGRPSIISTKGLEWDVQDWHTEFGGQVSTSNHIRSDVIDVDTTERVLFTVELARKVVR
ncbi:hypothetical protein MMC09_005059 [Bachmanniomyces sp. S44760]|nr:hypothetical protein [Bachmanniomyces sp. S44760]